MALPKIDTPTYEYTLPVSQIPITFRSFLVREEKLLLVGKESNVAQQINAMKQVISNVVITPEELDIESLPAVDLEMLFIQLRAKSIQNVVELQYRDKEDNELYKFNVDLEELEPTIYPDHTNEIELDDNLTIELRDPDIGLMTKAGMSVGEGDVDNEEIFKLIAGCLVKVYDKENVYDDFTVKEAIDFVKGFDIKRFEKLKEFFDTLPRLTYELDYTNKMDNKRKIVLNGVSDFF
tara:strand:+ start:5894 stop:6601 length:708 start_codon:yes stop_codon:yes gene_type:complete